MSQVHSGDGGKWDDVRMSRTAANRNRVPALVQGVVALLGVAFIVAAGAAAIKGDVLGALGYLLVASLAGAVIYLARVHPGRPLSRQKRVTQIAMLGILPLALIVQVLAMIF